MKLKNSKPIGLEALEDRWVPSTIRFDGSNLNVTNPLITGGKSTLSVIQVANNSFQVKDGAANNGFFAVTGNINIQGNNAKGTITVNVQPQGGATTGLLGNLTINTNNGASSITVDGTTGLVAPLGGSIAGNTFISVGNNANTVSFGSTNGVTNKGSLFVNARGTGANSITVGGGGTPTSVLGNTQISSFPTVLLGGTKGDLFAGNVNVSNGPNGQLSTVQLKTGASILGNFTVQGGNGNTTLKVDGAVLGFNSFNLGNGNNTVTFAGGGTAVTLGNLNLTAGNGNNSVTLNGGSALTVLGNAFLRFGNGTNVFGSTAGVTVNGNVQITDGNGSLDVGKTAAATNTFRATVFGNVNVNPGNGNNYFTFDGTNGASVGGSFFYNGGNGGNSVTVTNAPALGVANQIQLNVRFGNNNLNLFTLGAPGAPPTAGTISGIVSWGVSTMADANPPTINGFVDNGYVFANNITLINVPS